MKDEMKYEDVEEAEEEKRKYIRRIVIEIERKMGDVNSKIQ